MKEYKQQLTKCAIYNYMDEKLIKTYTCNLLTEMTDWMSSNAKDQWGQVGRRRIDVPSENEWQKESRQRKSKLVVVWCHWFSPPWLATATSAAIANPQYTRRELKLASTSDRIRCIFLITTEKLYSPIRGFGAGRGPGTVHGQLDAILRNHCLCVNATSGWAATLINANVKTMRFI